MYAEQQLRPWLDALVDAVPGLEIFDGHVHVGVSDPAGLEVEAGEIIDALGRIDARAVTFPLSEPSGYRAANERVLDLARRWPERIVPFARLDPADDAAGEARRCVEAGARGLKLHPRGEGFELDDDRLDGVFDLAHEANLPVLVHAGVGTPRVGRQAIDRANARPGARVVLAHCAVGSFESVVPYLCDVPNLLVDTSWWNVSDLWATFHLVPPSQILHGSDIPFNSCTQGAIMSGRVALQAGLTDDQVRAVMGGNLQRLIDGDELMDDAPPAPPRHPLPPELERLYVTLCSAAVPMLAGEAPGEGFELARASCAAPAGPHQAVLESVSQLLDIAEGCTDKDPLRPLRTPGFDVVLTAALVARTPDAALPQPGPGPSHG